MSLSDFLKPFSALPASDLGRALQLVGCTPEAGANSDDLLRLLSAEVLAIGVEDLLQRASEATRAELGARSAEELEARVKQDLVGFLEALPPALVRQLASEAGMRGGDESAAEPLRARLFEETVLLGAEGFLELQDEALLRALLGLAGAALPANDGRASLVEALMVRLFDLREREPAAAAVAAASAAQPAAKKARPAFASRSEVARLKVAELRAHCQERGLSADGLKADLVERLWAAAQK